MQTRVEWNRHRKSVLNGILILLGAVAATWLSYQFWRLVLSELPGLGAIDLRMRWNEVSAWFAGTNIYAEGDDAVYPPATYLMLWPLLGSPDLTAVRWCFCIFTLLVLWRLVVHVMRASGATSRMGRWLLALVMLAAYPVGATVGNGQTGLIVVLCLLAGLPLVAERNRSLGRDAWLTALFLVALVKPTMSAFFFWIVLFAAGNLRPSLLVCGGYALLTAVASLFQSVGPIDLVRAWVARGLAGSIHGARRGEGSIRPAELSGDNSLHITSVNLHSVLSYLRHVDLILPATLLVLGLLGLWVWFHRKCPIWILIGVTALVVRFGMYHGWYDDVVLLLPLITLFRIFKGEETAGPRLRWVAGSLFAMMSASLLAPGGVYTLPFPWNNVYVLLQTVIWLGVLLFLGFLACRSRAGDRRINGLPLT
ncbi:MAG: glycosyltransferase family 87 protein [Planctomycetota bacterium]